MLRVPFVDGDQRRRWIRHTAWVRRPHPDGSSKTATNHGDLVRHWDGASRQPHHHDVWARDPSQRGPEATTRVGTIGEDRDLPRPAFESTFQS